ncbi:inositol-pentakisphosphate 2-kinase [Physcia stellaris]|nr:inositol-pentakisphosphate 2-kinase [Physcia stellaris]
MEPLDLFTLDTRSGVRLSYLAEGAANIVYRPILPPASPSTEADFDFPVAQSDGETPATPPPTETPTLTADPRLEGKLIRLRKDLSTTVPVTESWAHFHNVVSPLFLDNQLVSPTLFHISRPVIHALNADLRAMERDGRRPAKRHGVYVDESEIYGTLVPDMSSDARSTSIEFKPKWLLQSPSAPAGSKRCRTCALRAMKARTSRNARDAGGFCPLNLVSGDRGKVSGVVEQLLASARFSDLDRLRVGDQLMRWLPKSLLLQRLTQLQDTLDPVGVLEADLEAQPFLTAMTLRDCTLFLKVRWPAPGISVC